MSRCSLAGSTIAFAVSFCLAAGAAQADKTDYTGPYAAAGFNLGYEIFESVPTEFQTALGTNLRAGYRPLSWLAVEGQFEYLSYKDADLGVDISGRSFTFFGNVKLPLLDGPLQPYLYGGIGMLRVDFDSNPDIENGTGFAGRFGGGVDFYLSERLALTTDVAWVNPTGDVDNLEQINWNIGFLARF